MVGQVYQCQVSVSSTKGEGAGQAAFFLCMHGHRDTKLISCVCEVFIIIHMIETALWVPFAIQDKRKTKMAHLANQSSPPVQGAFNTPERQAALNEPVGQVGSAHPGAAMHQ